MEQEVRATRESLANKIEQLEAHVTDSVEEVTCAARDTVTAAADAIQETVASVKDTVSETAESVGNAFSITHQTEQRPWLMIGGAVVAGYVAARYLMPSEAPVRLAPADRQALIDSLATDPRFCSMAAQEAVDEAQGTSRKPSSPGLINQGLRAAGFAIARALFRAALVPL
jgi:hypothetical protein